MVDMGWGGVGKGLERRGREEDQPANLSTTNILVQILSCGAVLCIAWWSAAPLTYTHWMPVAPPMILTTKHASRHCQGPLGDGVGGELILC